MSVKFLLHVVLAAIASRGAFAPTAAASSSEPLPGRWGVGPVQPQPAFGGMVVEHYPG